MNMKLREDKFHVRAFFAPCACSCRFCCLGDYPKDKRISFDDYEEVMKKFSDLHSSYGMRLRSFIYNCVEHPYVKRQIALYKQLGLPQSEFTQLDLNGTKIKSAEEISEWFDILQDAGMEQAAFSWFGTEQNHDRFVRRKGYYRYLNNCASEAAKRGIPVISKVFLYKGIMDDIETVISELESRGDKVICAFMEYSGNAKAMTEDFVTGQDLESLLPAIRPYTTESYLNKFKTESEWIRLAKNGEFPEFRIVDYILYLDADNIDRIREASVEDIIEYFREKNRRFMSSFGSVLSLAEKYGDVSCEILYECRDILRKWLDLYFEDNDLNKDELFSFTNNSVEWKIYERL